MNYKAVWKPLPGSQSLSLSCPCNEILYEGTRGPGKTAAQLARFRRLVGLGYGSFWRGVIFDTEYKNLTDIITQSKRMYRLFNDGARYLASASELRWVWPTGEELLFRFGKEESDYWDYHGQEFPFIGFNELTKQQSSEFYEMMFSCRRSSFRPENYPREDGSLLKPIPLETFSTTNPFGIGHTWVKKRFIEPAPRGTIIRETQKVFNPQTEREEDVTLTRVAIHGSFKENPYLDPQYIATLMAIKDPNRRKAWVEGSWDVTSGGRFDHLWNASYHVIKPFRIPDISTPNLDYGNMVQAWDINDALMGGTLYMRELGEAYLPRWPKEDKEDYKKRLAVATLLPAYEETINQNVGRVFAEPIQLGENVPDALREFARNVDLEGSRLDVWAQAFFSLAMQYGLSHALVDYPRIDAEQVKTKADEKATGARPYVTMLNPRQVIGWKSKMTGGKVALTELRIKEVVVEDGDDFGQTKVEQIRYLTPGKVQIYRKATGTDGQVNWALHEEWQTSRRDITLVTLYTKRTGFMCGSPPLLNMALLNVKHWQSQSEQDNILHVARVPILTVFGLEQGEELVIGSSSATQFSDRQKQGLEYVEHTGSSIGAGKESLAELVEQMRQAGAKLLRTDNTSTKSVDQTSEEKMQEQSPLYTMATSLEDAIDNILQIMAEYIGEKDGGSVDVRTELDVESKEFNPPAALAIQSLRQGGDIRRVDAIKSLQKLNIIDADADPDVVLSELLAESASLTEPSVDEV